MTTQPKDLTLEETIQAAKTMDWQQVVQNGGPPCFHLEENGSFCGRAKAWQGHGSKHTHHHRFIPLDELLSTTSALHHLEAGRRECRCGTFKSACEFWRDSTGVAKLSYGNPPVFFCPWCGGKVPTSQEVKP